MAAGGPDRRVSVVGDSLVAGVGDPDHLGWVGGVAARSHREGLPVTLYNLGVRRDTSANVLGRWRREVAARRAPGCDERVVLSFGVNDTAVESGAPRVDPSRSSSNLRVVLEGVAAMGLPVLMVGPPAVDDHLQNARIQRLDERFQAVCTECDVPYVSVVDLLIGDPVWQAEVRRGDGAHPGAAGYQVLADLVFPRWLRWLNAGRSGAAAVAGAR